MENRDEKIERADPDVFYRQAITELGRLNDRRFARLVSGGIAVGIFTYTLAYFLTHRFPTAFSVSAPS